MADPITREQVERAIEMAHVGNVYLSDFLGPGINWSLHAPDYVCRLWISPPLSPMRVRGTTALSPARCCAWAGCCGRWRREAL